MRKILVLSSILLFSTSFLLAQNVKTGGKENLIIKGFLSTTLFGQDQSFGFGNGQNAEWTTTNNTQNKWFYGGDIRNTRVTMVFNGPEISDEWKVGGVLELDAFGGFMEAGAFNQEQPIPRIRLAYADIVHDNLTIRIGQAWTPLFGNVPVSMSHIAFPLGYGNAGDVGWRFPGLYFYYKFNSNGSSTNFGLDAAIFEGSWSGPGSNVNFQNAGNAGSPQFELRLNMNSKISKTSNFKAYVVGHYDKKDLSGVGSQNNINLTGTAFEFGASYNVDGFLIHGNLYSGKNIGQQFGEMTQIQTVNKDLSSVGFWLQAGYNFTKEWGAFVFYGVENVNKDQAEAIFATPRLSQNLLDVMLRYETGPYGLGLELLKSKLTTGSFNEAETVFNETSLNGTQVAFSMLYHF